MNNILFPLLHSTGEGKSRRYWLISLLIIIFFFVGSDGFATVKAVMIESFQVTYSKNSIAAPGWHRGFKDLEEKTLKNEVTSLLVNHATKALESAGYTVLVGQEDSSAYNEIFVLSISVNVDRAFVEPCLPGKESGNCLPDIDPSEAGGIWDPQKRKFLAINPVIAEKLEITCELKGKDTVRSNRQSTFPRDKTGPIPVAKQDVDQLADKVFQSLENWPTVALSESEIFIDNFDESTSPGDIELYPRLYSIAYGNNTYIAVGDVQVYPGGYLKGCVIMKSEDGIHWTEQVRTDLVADKIFFLNGYFYIAQRTKKQDTILTSQDGNKWENNQNVVLPRGSVCFGKDLFVSVVEGDRDPILGTEARGSVSISKDLKTWNVVFDEIGFRDITFGKDLFVALTNVYRQYGFSFKLKPVIAVARNPSGPWKQVFAGGSDVNQLYSLSYGNGVFVAVGYCHDIGEGNDAEVLLSKDAVDWVQIESGINRSLSDVTFGHAGFVAVGYYGGIVCSRDGKKWEITKPRQLLHVETRDIPFFRN